MDKSKCDAKDLEAFLKKVNNINSIVSDLNAKDETTRQNALNQADDFLKKVGGKGEEWEWEKIAGKEQNGHGRSGGGRGYAAGGIFKPCRRTRRGSPTF